jgi:hypothetical protein
MPWQDSPSLETIRTSLASLLLVVTEDPRKLANDHADQESMEGSSGVGTTLQLSGMRECSIFVARSTGKEIA